MEFAAPGRGVQHLHSNFSLANPITFDGNSASYTYSSSAGQIYQSAAGSRQLQLALKLLF